MVGAGGEVVLYRGPCFVGDLDDAFAVALADDPQVLGLPVAAVESRISEIRAPVDSSSRISARSRLSASVSWGSASRS